MPGKRPDHRQRVHACLRRRRLADHRLPAVAVSAHAQRRARAFMSGANKRDSVPGPTNGVAYLLLAGWAITPTGAVLQSLRARRAAPRRPATHRQRRNATPGNGQAIVELRWRPAAQRPHHPPCGHRQPGGATATGGALPIVVPGLTQRHRLHLHRSGGEPGRHGAPSIASAPVTPMHPQGVPSAPGGLSDEVVSASADRLYCHPRPDAVARRSRATGRRPVRPTGPGGRRGPTLPAFRA